MECDSFGNLQTLYIQCKEQDCHKFKHRYACFHHRNCSSGWGKRNLLQLVKPGTAKFRGVQN